MRLDPGCVFFENAQDLVRDILMFAIHHVVTPEAIDRAALGDCHEPRGGVLRNAAVGPLLQRRNEGILREFFREPDIAHEPRQAGDESRRLDAPDRVERALNVGHDRERRLLEVRELMEIGDAIARAFEKTL